MSVNTYVQHPPTITPMHPLRPRAARVVLGPVHVASPSGLSGGHLVGHNPASLTWLSVAAGEKLRTTGLVSARVKNIALVFKKH